MHEEKHMSVDQTSNKISQPMIEKNGGAIKEVSVNFGVANNIRITSDENGVVVTLESYNKKVSYDGSKINSDFCSLVAKLSQQGE